MRTHARTIAVLGVVAFGVAGPATSAMAKKGRKVPPHLVVTRASVTGTTYVKEGDPARFVFRHVTKNKGGATAGRSRTGLFLFAPRSDRFGRHWQMASVRVVRLAPGDSWKSGSSTVARTKGLPFGRYRLAVCPDVNGDVQHWHRSNCAFVKRSFYVIARYWQGSLGGVGGSNGISKLEQWDGDPSYLSFDRYLGNGAFRYIANGTVAWNDYGIGGCIVSGKGSGQIDDSNSKGGVVLNYLTSRYTGKQRLTESFYIVTWSGGGDIGVPCDHHEAGPLMTTFLQMPRRHLGFGQETLSGHGGDSIAEHTAWKWHYEAAQ